MANGTNNGDAPEGEMYWRDKAIRNRLGFALENDTVYTDIFFIVGKEEIRIPAHKLILRLSSLVFENLISSHEEQGLIEIRLPNSSPSMFKRLLKFIYTDELEMCEFIQFLRVARDFGFLKLAEQSVQILKKTEMTPVNAVFMLDIAKGLGDTELEDSSLLYILNNADDVFNSKTFLLMSYVSLCQILLEDRLCSDELTVFKSVLRWTKFQCRRSSIPETAENLRGILKDARFYIRYPCMKYDQFLEEVKQSGILESSEYVQVLKCFVDISSNPLNIQTRPRNFQQALSHQPDLFNRRHNEPQQQAPVLPPDPRSMTGQFFDYSQSINLQEAPIMSTSIPAQMQMRQYTSQPIRRENTDDTEFQLKNCTIDFMDLLNAVQLQFSIQKIILHEVILQNAILGNGKRVYLPNLKLFHYYQHKDMMTKLPDKSFMNGISTKDFLFFEKKGDQKWDFSDLWALGVEICIDVKGIRLMEINPREHKLVLSYPVQEEADQILKGLKRHSNIKQVCLTACTITSAIEQLSTRNWEKLVLQGVRFEASKAQIINKCSTLQYLSIFSSDGTPINLATDLKNQRLTLLRLALAKANIGGWARNEPIVPFSKLEELYLDVCFWDLWFIERIHHIFPNLKRIAIRSKDSCRVCSRLMANILEIHSLEKIAIFRYPGGEDTHVNPNLDIFTQQKIPGLGTVKSAVLRFLVRCGMEFPDNNYVDDFILVKTHSLDGKSAPVWKAFLDKNDLDEIHFQYSQLFEFFTDSSSSKMIVD